MALTGRQKTLMTLALVLGAILLVMGLGYRTYRTFAKFVGTGEGESEAFSDAHGNLAVLEVSGVIYDSKEILKTIHELEEKEGLKAVVLRINSPGGAVAPSQEIYEALKELRKTKKLVCSFGDLAASGGYYIAAACEKIVANPGTLTGSIGVIMQFANLSGLYSWVRVEPITIKAGKFKDIGSTSRAMTDEERAMLQNMLDSVHRQFKTAVEKGRGFKPGYIDAYGDGRVFTGEQAKELGFVDELGGEDRAIKIAAEMAGIKGKPKIMRESFKKDRFARFFDSDSKYAGHGIEGEIGRAILNLAPNFQLQPGVAYLLPAYMFQGGGAR